MAAVPVAFPFIEVRIDTSALAPVAQRSPGVIAIVGKSGDGSQPANQPVAIDTIQQAADRFAKVQAGNLVRNPLFNGLEIAMLQDPKPAKIYGVKVEGDNFAAALASLEAADDVTFVALAGETDAGQLAALKTHAESMSAQGQRRIGIAMVDPALAKSNTYVADVTGALAGAKSSTSRMVVVAARGAQRVVGADAQGRPITITGDAASAAAAAIAGYPPHISIVLKRINGLQMPVESQYSPTEIKDLSEAGIIPIIDPALIVGESLHFAEGRCFTTDANLLFVDIVRTLDDIEFRLKAGLIGMIGDARITRPGLIRIKAVVEGILGPLVRNAVIDGFTTEIPVLNILDVPESARTLTDIAVLNEARANRTVDLVLSVTYGPAVHRLRVTLAPKF